MSSNHSSSAAVADEESMALTRLCCTVQNRLGALDRVLGAFTHRGIIPESLMSSVVSPSATGQTCLQVMISFLSSDRHGLEKLIKFLKKQVYVIDTVIVDSIPGSLTGDRRADFSEVALNNTNITPLFVSSVTQQEPSQRRMSHANNA